MIRSFNFTLFRDVAGVVQALVPQNMRMFRRYPFHSGSAESRLG